MRKDKDRNIGQHEEAAQLTKKYWNRNLKIDLPKIARQNLIETETVLLEDPLHEKKEQDVFDLPSKEKKEELQLHTKLEANKLPDQETNLITRNGMLTEITIFKCKKKTQKMNFMHSTGFMIPCLHKN